MPINSNDDKTLAILTSAVENTNEGFVTVDESHHVLFFNKAAERIFGFGREEVVGKDLSVIMTPQCSHDHRAAIEAYMISRNFKKTEHAMELVATRKNGERFPLSISFSMSEVSGKIYLTGIVIDLTETHALHERIARAERLAALGQFAAEITHEIKNPLVAIGGFARQLIPIITDKNGAKKLTIIIDEVIRLEKLLSQIREFYSPKQMVTSEVDVRALLNDVNELVKHDCASRNIQAIFDLGDSPLTVLGDKDKIKQVIVNLVKNSIEAIGTGGNICVSAVAKGHFVEIDVSDDGKGIPEANQKKIFSPFFSTKPNGTGLGLSVSKNIIEAHQGSSFSLQSKEGEGASFKIKMPIVSGALESKSKARGKS